MGVSSLALNDEGVSTLKAGNLTAALELFSKVRVCWQSDAPALRLHAAQDALRQALQLSASSGAVAP